MKERSTLTLSELADAIGPPGRSRRLVAVAGPPGAGKSTVAEALARHMGAALVAQDGWHLDDVLLDERGLRARKGAPNTFDVAGLRSALERIRAGEDVLVPVFDRTLDIARNCAARVAPDAPLVLVEGNYLLLGDAPWDALAPLLDFTILLAPSLDTLRERLVQRWLDHGRSPRDAAAWVESNDLPNARAVLDRSRDADIRVGHVDLAAG